MPFDFLTAACILPTLRDSNGVPRLTPQVALLTMAPSIEAPFVTGVGYAGMGDPTRLRIVPKGWDR